MKYFILLTERPDATPWGEMTPEAQQAEMEMHGAFAAESEARPGVQMVGGEALADASTATTMRTRNGETTITDGPFAEAAEQIGGFYVLEAPDLDTVTDLCRLMPAYDIEIRPVLDFG